MIFTKYIVVVADDVAMHNNSEVLLRPAPTSTRNATASSGPSDELDQANGEIGIGSTLGIDATKKLPGEGFKRPWPTLLSSKPKNKCHRLMKIRPRLKRPRLSSTQARFGIIFSKAGPS